MSRRMAAGEEAPDIKVWHCKDRYMPKDAVYVGRPGPWGNPFIVNTHGDRATVVAKYEEWIKTQPKLLARLPELKGKHLACWCAPLPCHGDVLMRLANTKEKKK